MHNWLHERRVLGIRSTATPANGRRKGGRAAARGQGLANAKLGGALERLARIPGCLAEGQRPTGVAGAGAPPRLLRWASAAPRPALRLSCVVGSAPARYAPSDWPSRVPGVRHAPRAVHAEQLAPRAHDALPQQGIEFSQSRSTHLCRSEPLAAMHDPLLGRRIEVGCRPARPSPDRTGARQPPLARAAAQRLQAWCPAPRGGPPTHASPAPLAPRRSCGRWWTMRRARR